MGFSHFFSLLFGIVFSLQQAKNQDIISGSVTVHPDLCKSTTIIPIGIDIGESQNIPVHICSQGQNKFNTQNYRSFSTITKEERRTISFLAPKVRRLQELVMCKIVQHAWTISLAPLQDNYSYKKQNLFFDGIGIVFAVIHDDKGP